MALSWRGGLFCESLRVAPEEAFRWWFVLGVGFLGVELLGEHNRLMGHFPAFIPFCLLSGWL
ncbi:hypothetical protein [Bartonella sp. MM73XJBT]|uniref:hypothetical protein n=1 Tax=Bartonella sp. MM73XJBT TaxID=3019095 RepID=UPI002360B492|nr:hypothetical protein [Bartonella sp. MM73XJBT]